MLTSGRYFLSLAVFSLLLSATACNTDSNGGGDARYYEFTHEDGSIDYSFVAKTSDPDVIRTTEEELNRPFGERTLHINGDIARGNDGYNRDWSWHFVPDEWEMTEISVEVCDGRPGMVEEDLEYWVDQVGYFCPWSSRVLREVNVEGGI